MTRPSRTARKEQNEPERSATKSMTPQWIACGVLLFAFAIALGKKAGVPASGWLIWTVMTVGIIMILIGLLTWWRSKSSNP